MIINVMVIRGFQVLYLYLHVKKYKQRSSKIPVIPTIHNSANITYCILCEQLYLYYYTCKYVCNHNYVIMNNVLPA